MTLGELIRHTIQLGAGLLYIGRVAEMKPDHDALVFEHHAFERKPIELLPSFVSHPAHQLLVASGAFGDRDRSSARVFGAMCPPDLQRRSQPFRELDRRST